MPNRRSFLAASTAATGAAISARAPLAALADSPSQSAQFGGLVPFPAREAPFADAGRRNLAADLLTYFVKQKGLFPGRGVYLLPAAPWFGGWEPASSRMAWDLTIPAGQALYLLAAASSAGSVNPAATSISVNGDELTGLADYVHDGVTALHEGESKSHSVLDLVFAPPAPGRYKIEVETGETTLLYDVSVRASDALGAILLRAPDGRTYATHGGERRLVPDADTVRALGYPAHATLDASADFLERLPEGPALPPLRDGMLVRSSTHRAVFRLERGKRVWLRDAPAPSAEDPDGGSPFVQIVDAAVLGAIPPVLQHNMLLKSDGADVFHVDGAALRKVPDWKWATERRLDPADTFYVPERILFALPQNSPHWVQPGGTFEDHSFESDALDRPMPYRVFLPPDYYAASRAGQRYPVLYLLHGMGGRYDEWSGYGVEEVANLLFRDGKLAHTIIVAPQGGLGYWMNQDNGTLWGDYVARDLVSHVDAAYRTIARREARAIGGLSMGGHGALQLALNYPNVFGIVGAHSASIRSESSAPRYFGRGGGFARRDPLTLVTDARLNTPPRIWLDAGSDDDWRPRIAELHETLQSKGWEHEYHIYDGGHDGWYWGDHIWDYLPFYSRSFEKNGIPVVR